MNNWENEFDGKYVESQYPLRNSGSRYVLPIGIKKLIFKAISQSQKEAVEEYTKFLIEHGYVDDDVWSEKPTAIERFLKEKE